MEATTVVTVWDILKWIVASWGPFALILGIIGTWYINKIVNPKLYATDGTTIFVPRVECADDREECRKTVDTNVCLKIDAVKQTVDLMQTTISSGEEKRDQARRDYMHEITGLARAVHSLEGKFEQYTKDH